MQPRERYTLLGPEGFGDLDLIALILGTGAAGRSSRSIATDLVDRFGGLPAMAQAPVEALAAVRGVGPVRAVRIHASLALGRRCQALPIPETPIRTAEDAVAWFQPAFQGLLHEELHGIYLDRRGRPLAYRRLTRGHDGATIVDSRQVLRPAVELGSTGVVLGHNHPSGDPEPSAEDRAVTRRVQSAANVLGIRLVDHVVVAGDRHVSMAARGDLS
jgi:DNA repair protein RadC